MRSPAATFLVLIVAFSAAIDARPVREEAPVRGAAEEPGRTVTLRGSGRCARLGTRMMSMCSPSKSTKKSGRCMQMVRKYDNKDCAPSDALGSSFCTEDGIRAGLANGETIVIVSTFCPGGALDITLQNGQLEASSDGALVCVGDCSISGGRTSRVLEIKSGVQFAIVGVDIKNGFVEATNGGCIALERGGIGTTLSLTGLEISGCIAVGTSVDGGAVFVSRVSAGNTVVAMNVVFRDNTVVDEAEGKGGAMYVNGGGNAESKEVNTFIMSGGGFFENNCIGPLPGFQDNCIGGGLYSGRNTFVQIDGAQFERNTANTYGGAINTFPWGTDITKFDPTIGRPMTLLLSNCGFEGNTSAFGASLYASTLPEAPLDRLTLDMFNLEFRDPFVPPSEMPQVQVCLYNSCGTNAGAPA